jgi:hypothetical protein
MNMVGYFVRRPEQELAEIRGHGRAVLRISCPTVAITARFAAEPPPDAKNHPSAGCWEVTEIAVNMRGGKALLLKPPNLDGLIAFFSDTV